MRATLTARETQRKNSRQTHRVTDRERVLSASGGWTEATNIDRKTERV